MSVLGLTNILNVICGCLSYQDIQGIDWKTDLLGVSYNGTLNVTTSGRICQAWWSQTPHKHLFTKISDQSNYCRNPSLDYPGPWCYTTDPNVKYEYCPIYLCGVYCSGGFFKCDDGMCLQEHLKCNGFVDCSGGEDELYCYDEVNECMTDSTGLTYRGKVSTTQAGDKCLRWTDTTYQRQLNHTYCRNFSAKLKGPWCFKSSTDWAYCEVPLCEKQREDDCELVEQYLTTETRETPTKKTKTSIGINYSNMDKPRKTLAGFAIATVMGIVGASSMLIALYQCKNLLHEKQNIGLKLPRKSKEATLDSAITTSEMEVRALV